MRFTGTWLETRLSSLTARLKNLTVSVIKRLPGYSIYRDAMRYRVCRREGIAPEHPHWWIFREEMDEYIDGLK
jgi:hypothetical protein